jgi:hypothetical protein
MGQPAGVLKANPRRRPHGPFVPFVWVRGQIQSGADAAHRKKLDFSRDLCSCFVHVEPNRHGGRPDVERPDGNETERPDWHTRLPANERLEALHPDDDVNRARITRDLTVVSRTPALATIPALRAPAAALAGRTALLTGASLRLVNSS